MSDEEFEWGNIADYANKEIVRDENEVDEDEDEISDDDSEEPTVPENKDVYNRVALLQKLEEIALPKNTPWTATLALNSGATHEGINSEDDFNREVSFYKQAVAGCVAARTRFEAEGFKYKRPTDYFAEMVKADTHMAKVRQNLLDQQKRLEAVEERRRQRELKKFGKKVQIEKEQARAHQKKQEIEAVKKWRKGLFFFWGIFQSSLL
jgi:rRNA-processing protein EBP2